MNAIRIRGARTHNLKNLDLDLPSRALVVITGPSGSGKSSLAFDTIFAEGQRRYVESLSPRARQFLNRMPRPDLDSIDGLSPTIAIDQRFAGGNPRSTVGTATEIHDFLRLLFSRAGSPHCPSCGKPVRPMSVDEMVDAVQALPEGTRLAVLAPLVRGEKGDLAVELKRLRREGFVRVSVDGVICDLSDEIPLDKKKAHDLDVFVDRLAVSAGVRNRLADSLELALKEGHGLVVVSPAGGGDALTFTDRNACAACGFSMASLEPSAFSFNSPEGACPTCSGLGVERFFDEARVIPDESLSLREGAVEPWERRNAAHFGKLLEAAVRAHGIDPFSPWRDLREEQRRLVLYGADDFEGVIPNLERRRKEAERRRAEGALEPYDIVSDELGAYLSSTVCGACKGTRLKKESLSVRVGGKNLAEVSLLSIAECDAFFRDLTLSPKQTAIAAPLVSEIRARLGFLSKVGLDYLSLERAADTLSGGESQRIRLATQIGASLVGVTYVLDEPSVGLHPRDTARLLATVRELVDRGNTAIVVEHDAEAIRAADHVVDMGPRAGRAGGEITAAGTPAEISRNPKSLTGGYLAGRLEIAVPKARRAKGDRAISLVEARTHNLKAVSVDFPLGLFVAVTGVSGSGKSSLVVDTLLPAVRGALSRSKAEALSLARVTGTRGVDKIIDIDQSPIGRTPHSNPATFVQVFGHIRDFFAALPEAKTRGYGASRFSFNVKGGRCEACRGDGLIRVEMSFLPDAFVTCEVCGGKRYNRETLEVRYRGLSIADVLSLSCEEARDRFESHPKIRKVLDTVLGVGLGYLELGQNAATLSSGEAQRLKLAKELARTATGNTLYVLDEPTTGLHFEDIKQLLSVLEALVDQGNTVVVIEHNLDVIKCADWVIELGPEGGDRGGEIVAVGTPEDIARLGTSTGEYLRRSLQ